MASKIRVLFLAADPFRIPSALRLDAEARAIAEAMQRGALREAFELSSCWAVRAGDLQTALLQHRPQVVHFAGHAGARTGIWLEDDSGQPQAVDQEALADLFAIERHTLRVVLLNACETATTMEAFAGVVDYTIGMQSAMADVAAVHFSAAFYGALAFGRTVSDAFALGVNRLKIEKLPDADLPRLHVRDGVDLSQPLSSPIARGDDDAGATVTVTNAKVNEIINVGGHRNSVVKNG